MTNGDPTTKVTPATAKDPTPVSWELVQISERAMYLKYDLCMKCGRTP